MELTRQKLYKRIWAKAATHVAKELGISDVALGKICQKHNVPKPPPGYWAQKEVGRQPKQPPLPAVDEPGLEEIVIEADRYRAQRVPLSPEGKRQAKEEKLESNRIIVPDKLDAPHTLVERTLRSLNASAPDRDGIVSPRAQHCLKVAVGKDSIDRAMRIMDTLLKAAETRNLSVAAKEHVGNQAAIVTVEGEAISLRMTESLGQREKPPSQEKQEQYARLNIPIYPEREKYPRGPLTLVTEAADDGYITKRWSELDGRKLEHRLNQIMVWFFNAASRIKERRREHEEWERQRVIEEKKREERERLERIYATRAKRLDAQVARWQNVTVLRAYIQALEAAAVSKFGGVEASGRMGKWIEFAKGRADKLDPITALSSPPKSGYSYDDPFDFDREY